MGLLNSLSNLQLPLVLDTSVVINLNASGFASKIIKALPNRAFVAGSVCAELEVAKDTGRHDGRSLGNLIAAELVEQAELNESGSEIFTRLVTGSAAMTLDDGEAATIAYAVQCGGVAVIDERKANRICAELFPTLKVGCTSDIFMHPVVVKTLKREELTLCVRNALRLARMRVFQEHASWVLDLIGAEEAKVCVSLPKSMRQSSHSAVPTHSPGRRRGRQRDRSRKST